MVKFCDFCQQTYINIQRKNIIVWLFQICLFVWTPKEGERDKVTVNAQQFVVFIAKSILEVGDGIEKIVLAGWGRLRGLGEGFGGKTFSGKKRVKKTSFLHDPLVTWACNT